MSPVSPKRRGRPKDEKLTARRREQILDVATRHFAQRGFPNTDVQDVADQLGVGKGTVYRYFPTKQALFLGAVDRAMRLLGEQVHASVACVEDSLEQIACAVRAYLAFIDAHPEFVELLMQERAEFKDRKKPTYFVHRDANTGRWEELMRGLIRQGRMRDVPTQRVIDVINDLVYGTIFTNYFADRRRSFEQQADDILDVVFQGILSDPERKRRRATNDT